MSGAGDITAFIAAAGVFVLGFLFAIPSPIDLAIIIAESMRVTTLGGEPATQITTNLILGLRILGWAIMLSDLIGLAVLFRKSV